MLTVCLAVCWAQPFWASKGFWWSWNIPSPDLLQRVPVSPLNASSGPQCRSPSCQVSQVTLELYQSCLTTSLPFKEKESFSVGQATCWLSGEGRGEAPGRDSGDSPTWEGCLCHICGGLGLVVQAPVGSVSRGKTGCPRINQGCPFTGSNDVIPLFIGELIHTFLLCRFLSISLFLFQYKTEVMIPILAGRCHDKWRGQWEPASSSATRKYSVGLMFLDVCTCQASNCPDLSPAVTHQTDLSSSLHALCWRGPSGKQEIQGCPHLG